jgi:serine/threonine protein kinase
VKPGDILHGRYRIERTLGHGGMGGVYLATHLELEVPVAVKELVFRLADPADHAAAIRQFRSEAQMLHRLHHPNLPRVYDFFESSGAHFLVMDYVDGHTLEQELRHAGPMAEDEVLRIALEVLDVLGYMHGQKPPIIFRDLKPANVMLDMDRNVKLIDFGIAKLIEEHGGKTSTIIRSAGTPGFAAPEQYGAGTDERSDVYSLGATLYTLLTAKVPPPSPALAVDAAQLTPLSDVRPDVSYHVRMAVARMMEANPGRRPRSTREVVGLLTERAEARPRADPPPSAPPMGDMPPTVPLGSLRFSGDTSGLADPSHFRAGFDDDGPQQGFTGFVGDVRRTRFTPTPVWDGPMAERDPEPEPEPEPEPLPPPPPPARRPEPVPVAVVPPAERASEPWRWPSLSTLPTEVTVPVLIGVLAGIVFLLLLAAFLRGHSHHETPEPTGAGSLPVLSYTQAGKEEGS